MVHASNSATSIWHAETAFNAVRLGVVIYGLNPSGSALELPYNIRPALSLETALVHVKILPAGQDVGYGATYTTTADEVIGTIPLGYGMVGPEIYKVSTLLLMDSFAQLLGVCLWTRSLFAFLRFIP